MHPTEAEKAQPRKRAKFSIAAIYLRCPCGGECVNQDGSYMIEPHSDSAKCEQCGKDVKIPKGAKR